MYVVLTRRVGNPSEDKAPTVPVPSGEPLRHNLLMLVQLLGPALTQVLEQVKKCIRGFHTSHQSRVRFLCSGCWLRCLKHIPGGFGPLDFTPRLLVLQIQESYLRTRYHVKIPTSPCIYAGNNRWCCSRLMGELPIQSLQQDPPFRFIVRLGRLTDACHRDTQSHVPRTPT